MRGPQRSTGETKKERSRLLGGAGIAAALGPGAFTSWFRKHRGSFNRVMGTHTDAAMTVAKKVSLAAT